MSILLALAAGASLSPPPAAPPSVGPELVVTGSRPERHPLGRAEAPYPETIRTPLGSRIARRVAERPFLTIATESGVAGILHGSGMDGTGGSTPAMSARRVTDCVAGDRQVRPQIACIFVRVQRDTRLGELAAARAALAPLLTRSGMNGAETHHTGHLAYVLAQAQEDEGLRAQALRLLLASGRLSEADHARAARSLATLATNAR